MNYKQFDNNESPIKLKYANLHKEIFALLQEKPMNIYELREAIKNNFGLSGQLQFLKSKRELANKRFSGVVYWALPKENRTYYHGYLLPLGNTAPNSE